MSDRTNYFPFCHCNTIYTYCCNTLNSFRQNDIRSIHHRNTTCCADSSYSRWSAGHVSSGCVANPPRAISSIRHNTTRGVDSPHSSRRSTGHISSECIFRAICPLHSEPYPQTPASMYHTNNGCQHTYRRVCTNSQAVYTDRPLHPYTNNSAHNHTHTHTCCRVCTHKTNCYRDRRAS